MAMTDSGGPSRHGPSRRGLLFGFGSILVTANAGARAAAALTELRVDYATYNPLSLVIRSRRLLETAFAPDGVTVRWVQSLGSNKALEFLNAESIDIGSTAGAAALMGRVNGNPIKTVGLFSRPEWTALVCPGTASLRSPGDLKGRRIAVTRGTDPHVFLVRALETAGLTERDVKLVLLQHPDGKTALLRGDVDAWAGLDPLMAQTETDDGARLFYRRPAFNSAGVINVREAFAAAHPDAVRRVLRVYEEARLWARDNADAFKAILVAETRLPGPVVSRQLERTDLSSTTLAATERDSIVAAGIALQRAGLIDPATRVETVAGTLFDAGFAAHDG